jgi:hypothetical protein
MYCIYISSETLGLVVETQPFLRKVKCSNPIVGRNIVHFGLYYQSRSGRDVPNFEYAHTVTDPNMVIRVGIPVPKFSGTEFREFLGSGRSVSGRVGTNR